jgi:hypothetical protein
MTGAANGSQAASPRGPTPHTPPSRSSSSATTAAPTSAGAMASAPRRRWTHSSAVRPSSAPNAVAAATPMPPAGVMLGQRQCTAGGRQPAARAARESQQRGLRGGVRDVQRRGCRAAARRREIHDRAAASRAQQRRHGPRSVEHAAHVDVDAAPPTLPGKRIERLDHRQRARVVDDHLDRAEAIASDARHALGIDLHRHVGRYGDCLVAERLDRCGRALELLHPACCKHDGMTGMREAVRYSQSESPARTGDDRGSCCRLGLHARLDEPQGATSSMSSGARGRLTS